MVQFRNTMGLEFCSMEDEAIILGIRATRALRGARAKLNQGVIEEARNTVPADRERAARELIGPRGGLPTLKKDLVRLCVLMKMDDDTWTRCARSSRQS